MSNRRLIRWSLVLLIFAAFAVWLAPTRVVWGWLRGEVFFDGRPTSYWQREFDRWEMHVGYGKDATGKEERNEFWVRAPGWLDRWLDKEGRRKITWPNPRCERVDAAAMPVLLELLVDDSSYRVQKLANHWIRVIDDANAEGFP